MYKIYIKVNSWLASWGSDKYLHLLACLLVSFIVAAGLHIFISNKGNCSLAGFGLAFCLGIAKEMWDHVKGGDFDITDLDFSTTGALIGMLLFLLN